VVRERASCVRPVRLVIGMTEYTALVDLLEDLGDDDAAFASRWLKACVEKCNLATPVIQRATELLASVVPP